MGLINPFIGDKCNKRIRNIPFKPLSERMLEEPFWLGLIAVTVVMSLIGICYLVKKHCEERFDSLLTDKVEAQKNPAFEGHTGKVFDMNRKSFHIIFKINKLITKHENILRWTPSVNLLRI